MTRSRPAAPPATPAAYASGSGFAVTAASPARPASSRDPERRTGARMIALGLALRLKLGISDGHTLGLAVIAAEEALDPGDPVREEVGAIAGEWPVLQRSVPELLEAGERLFRAVLRSSWPAPSSRADIGG